MECFWHLQPGVTVTPYVEAVTTPKVTICRVVTKYAQQASNNSTFSPEKVALLQSVGQGVGQLVADMGVDGLCGLLKAALTPEEFSSLAKILGSFEWPC